MKHREFSVKCWVNFKHKAHPMNSSKITRNFQLSVRSVPIIRISTAWQWASALPSLPGISVELLAQTVIGSFWLYRKMNTTKSDRYYYGTQGWYPEPWIPENIQGRSKRLFRRTHLDSCLWNLNEKKNGEK